MDNGRDVRRVLLAAAGGVFIGIGAITAESMSDGVRLFLLTRSSRAVYEEIRLKYFQNFVS